MQERKPYAYPLFAITGVVIFAISFFNPVPFINIHDTYFVINPVLFGVTSLAFYTALSAFYFLFRNSTSNKIAVAHYLFTTVPLAYFIFSDYFESNDAMICVKTDLVSKFICILPMMLLVMFVIGLLLFTANLFVIVNRRFLPLRKNGSRKTDGK